MQARAGRYDDSLATFLKVHDEAGGALPPGVMLEHLKEIELCRQQLQAALDKDPRMEKAQALLAQLERRAGRRGAADLLRSRPARTPRRRRAAAPDNSTPAAKAVLLPPPPRFPIRYENTDARSAGWKRGRDGRARLRRAAPAQ